ncbi:putative ABC-type xenobiotic transporter [Helianthus annuus]|uniref:ABC-type xenobiotic transporter n=2 Tax=Helianthus annuus TaxID=4232 RepID=A0A251SDS0_HELAN|nr:putative ABC-type xenobiotic transporter [Helianthus annuus]KAJ0462909.1 putative ABC-type xenobiotic transporter [Helianthus annuus]KAJ0484260.1 putative ABC-type xenobiotic transporter [Helianthus annuus]KAJ0658558.1 putative ABC-type xenobiotic transporter [Helianthus annuus]
MREVEIMANQDSGEVPTAKAEEQGDDSSLSKKNASFSGLFYAADKWDFLLMLFGSIGACIHGAALPVFFVLFGRMIDSLGHLSTHPHSLSSQVSKNSLYLIYLGLVVFISSWIGVACWMQTGERQTARLRFKYLQSVLRKDIKFFDTKAKDQNILFHISSDAILVQDAIGDKIGHGLRYLSQFFVGFVVGFTSVWQLTLLTLAIVPLIAFAGGAYTMIMSTLSEKSEAAYAESGKIAEENISQIRTVYSFVGENKAIDLYSRSLQNALKLARKSGFAKGIGIGFTYALLFCAWALLLWYAGILVQHHHTNGGKAFTTIINVIFSGFALGQAAPNLAAVAKGKAAAGNIVSMIKEDVDTSRKSKTGMAFSKVNGNIEFRDVCFAYPSRPNTVLDDLSFSVGAGKRIAIVGPSGSGKSTIISLIQRFYEPTSGQILLDGHDIKNLQLNWLRGLMGLVSQEPALFATTISENILYGKPNADMNHIIQVSKAANADSFIQQLPDGYQTQVGEGGTQLSGGQKQRIAIARATLRNPKILLLDEATSALDSESELIVQQSLNTVMSNRTTIIVAHRLSTIRDVDTIIVLKNGQVVEKGTHSDLVAKGGEYANLVNLQSSEPTSTKVQTSVTQHSYYHNFDSLTTKTVNPDGENESLSSSTKHTPSIWDLVKLNKPEWPYAVMGSLGAILAGMQAPLFALGITYILTSFYSGQNSKIKEDVERASFIFVAAGVVTIPIYMLQHYFYTLMGERLTTRVRLSMFSAILTNEVGWFDKDENSTGSLMSKLAADATLVRSALADRLSTIVQNISLTVTAFVISFVLSWRIALVIVSTFPLLIGASITEQLFLKGFGGDYTTSYSRATSMAREAIANIRTIAAFGAEERLSSQFATELNLPGKQARIRGHISGFGYGFSQLLAFSSYALGLWYASVLIKHRTSNFGDIIKAFMVLIITALSIAETLALAPDIVKGTQALGSVFEILNRKSAINPDQPDSLSVNRIKGDVEFRNVIFAYPTRPDVYVLNGLNLKIMAGNSMAIVGPSGSGKSTVIGLVSRFYDPVSGSVFIDDLDIKRLNLKSLRRRIGLVQQEPSLFSTTIYDNIKYGNEEASEIEIINAAKLANAHEFISRMPESYKTEVGNNGVQLSGGQKQRVAIARAVLKDPSILLLDEATSALDTASERLVQEALDKLMEGRTTILVAHRLSTIRNADSIAVLQNGKVVECGTHDTLVGMHGSVYSHLVSLQQERSIQAESI